MLAKGELESAGAVAEELASLAAEVNAPLVQATAAQTTGAVLLARGEPTQALAPLREAWTLWQRLEAPFESARVRVLMGRACERLGDRDTARMHLDAAAAILRRVAVSRPSSRAVNARCSHTSRPARRTAGSPPTWGSASIRSHATSATSSTRSG